LTRRHILETCRTQQLQKIIREIKGMTTQQIPISKINQTNPKALKESNLKHWRMDSPPTRNIPMHRGVSSAVWFGFERKSH